MSLFHCIFSFVLLVTLVGAIPLLKNVDVLKNNETLRADVNINYRLPGNVIPSYYRIKLDPDIANKFTFSGESSINIRIHEWSPPSKMLILHSKNLNYDETATFLIDSTGKLIKPIIHSLDNLTDFLTLTFARNITAGYYTLKLKYNGTLINDDYHGFYRSSYKNDQGNDVWLATTQFQPTHARLAFPCFDEPAMKAKFEISIKHFENYTAVSNMPAVSQTRENNDFSKWWTNFDVTPVMSTYLVAFVISDFNYLSKADQTFRVWSRKNAIHLGKYGLAIGQVELKELEDYTGFKHVIPKMDNFAIPQFATGAMENWGIVTYREDSLLLDENVTSTKNKQQIAAIISHEFAHQWFGNLVSPKWWEFLWLNEGLATYFQYYTTDKAEPTWRLMEQFVIEHLQENAFLVDDFETQHPMEVTVQSPDQIQNLFDPISYDKAGCIIRMISHALGESVFHDGLKKYINKMKYSSATSFDLFDAFAKAKGAPRIVPLVRALESWSTQAGFPVVTVIRDHKAKTAVITQKRFLTKKPSQPRNETWWIPFNCATQSSYNFTDTSAEFWFEGYIPTKLYGFKENEWLILNKQQTGYYRVNYDVENWKLIAKYLNSPNYTNIHVINRAQLLDDSFKLAQAGELENHTVFLEISKYLEREDDYVPWYPAKRAFSTLNNALMNTENYHLFQLYIQRLIEKLEKSVGYTETDQDDHVTKLNRINAVSLACMMGSKKCLDATHKKLVEYLSDSKKISTDLQSVVLCSGIRTADEKLWESTYNLTAGLEKSDERSIILIALGCSSNVKNLKFYLNQTLVTGTKLSTYDVINVVSFGSPIGADVVFDFLRDNLKVLIDADGDTELVEDYFFDIGGKMTTVTQIDKLEKFIESLANNGDEKLADTLKKMSLDRAKANLDWLKKYEAQIAMFLKGQKLIR